MKFLPQLIINGAVLFWSFELATQYGQMVTVLFGHLATGLGGIPGQI